MMAAPLFDDEEARQQLLRDMQILDTEPEPAFDGLTRCARRITGYPIALVSLIDGQRQWFKSRDGLEIQQTRREVAFCAHAVASGDTLEVPDAAEDPRFSGNPLVAGHPYIRAYAGHPICVRGVRVGTVCVIDHQRRQLQRAQLDALAALADVAGGLLAERLNRALLALAKERMAAFGTASGDWLWETDAGHRLTWLSDECQTMTGLAATALLGHPLPGGILLDARGCEVVPAASLSERFSVGKAFNGAQVMWSLPAGTLYLSFSAVPVTAADGSFCGFRGTARNVSARAFAEQEREAATQRLGSLVAEVSGALYQFRVDQQGLQTFPQASEPFNRLFELAPAAAAVDANLVFERIHPGDRVAVDASIRRSMAGMLKWRKDFRVLLPIGGVNRPDF